jgi:hypothetical protein
MKLFTNGCSFTWGAEILENQLGVDSPSIHEFTTDSLKYEKFRQEHVWSYLLKNKFDDVEKYDNLSKGGSSNKRIVRTTIDYFLNLIDKGIRVDDYVAVIQWTDANRYEVYDTSINNYLYMHHRGVFYPNIKDPSHINQMYKLFVKERYKLDEQNFKDEFRNDIILLSSFFHQHDIKYVFCLMDENSGYIQPGYCKDNIVWLGDTNQDSSMTSILKKYEINFNRTCFYPEKHPNLLGHKIIAETIYNTLKELYNL